VWQPRRQTTQTNFGNIILFSYKIIVDIFRGIGRGEDSLGLVVA
jgi:hypothetical protein